MGDEKGLEITYENWGGCRECLYEDRGDVSRLTGWSGEEDKWFLIVEGVVMDGLGA